MVHRVLHYSPYMAGMIIYATMCLHNMCIESNIHEGEEPEIENEETTVNDQTSQWHSMGEQARQRYIDTNII